LSKFLGIKTSVTLEDIQKAIKEMQADGFIVVPKDGSILILGKPKKMKEKVQFT